MNINERIKLIKENTEEIVQENELQQLLQKKDKPIVYLGYSSTGLLHIGHLIPLIKFADFVKANFECKLLVADLHAWLDGKKAPWSELEPRTKLYTEIIRAALESLEVHPSKVTFVKGSDMQLDKGYVLDLFRLIGEVNLSRAKRSAAEVVRFGDNPKVGGFVYPLLQALDTKWIGADVAIGGVDQRSIYMLAREILELVGHQKPIAVLLPLLEDLSGQKSGKMSSSNRDSIVSLVDSAKEIENKLGKAYCPVKVTENNGVLSICKLIIFPILKGKSITFTIERNEKYGGNISISSYLDLERQYSEGKIHPADLKKSVTKYLTQIISPIRSALKKEDKLLKKIYNVTL